ncbi:protein of unknown function [Hyphomicrobium sp. 1Nfss2.1]
MRFSCKNRRFALDELGKLVFPPARNLTFTPSKQGRAWGVDVLPFATLETCSSLPRNLK